MLINDPFEQGTPRIYRILYTRIMPEFSTIEIGYNQLPPDLHQILKRNVYIIHYVVRGKGTICSEKFEKGDVYVVTPGMVEIMHSDKDDPYETYWIMVTGSGAENLLRKHSLLDGKIIHGFENTDVCAKIIHNALFEKTPQTPFEEEALLQSTFFSLLYYHTSHIKEEIPSPQLTARKIMNYIKENYARQIKIEDIAKNNNISRNYLYTMFQKEFGVSPKEYLLSLRIEKAKDLLCDTSFDLTVGQIAFATGFTDPLYFSRIFRKKTGITPQQYKKARR